MNQLSKAQISKLVKQGRIAKGYTQQQLCDLARISLRSVQRIENAEVLPRMYTLKILAENLGFMDALIAHEEGKSIVVQDATEAVQLYLNTPRKLILSVSTGLVLVLLVGAFLSQSVKFPETNFELFLFLIAVIAVYVFVLFKIWK